MVAQNSAGRQSLCEAAQPVSVGFVLTLFGRGRPMQKNIPPRRIATARVVWISGFLFVHTVRCKSYGVPSF
jgi:hypothetical protein